MFRFFGQFAATSQFYLYGRSRCTRTGWEKASSQYEQPDLLAAEDLSLANKVYIVTGANAGIGREMASFLAKKQARVFMVCRNAERGEKARARIVSESLNDKVHLLVGDCGLESDVRSVWDEFVSLQGKTEEGLRLDCLICNAGALLNERTLTKDGLEVTFATHLLFGTYLLGSLALDVLRSTADSRMVVVSSGGMYNTKFPRWEVATSQPPHDTQYDGQFAYAYAKRGQVLLVERWAEREELREKEGQSSVKIVSCHPGWTQSEGLDAAYGSQKSYLEPLRTAWEGAEGILWLAVAPRSKLQGGAFYLDRSPQVKHMAGPFFTEGSFTKNSPAEVDEMMRRLELWSSKETREEQPQKEG